MKVVEEAKHYSFEAEERPARKRKFSSSLSSSSSSIVASTAAVPPKKQNLFAITIKKKAEERQERFLKNNLEQQRYRTSPRKRLQVELYDKLVRIEQTKIRKQIQRWGYEQTQDGYYHVQLKTTKPMLDLVTTMRDVLMFNNDTTAATAAINSNSSSTSTIAGSLLLPKYLYSTIDWKQFNPEIIITENDEQTTKRNLEEAVRMLLQIFNPTFNRNNNTSTARTETIVEGEETTRNSNIIGTNKKKQSFLMRSIFNVYKQALNQQVNSSLKRALSKPLYWEISSSSEKYKRERKKRKKETY